MDCGVREQTAQDAKKKAGILPAFVDRAALLGDPPRNQVERTSGPEQKTPHANHTAIADSPEAIVGLRLLKHMNGCLSGKQSDV